MQNLGVTLSRDRDVSSRKLKTTQWLTSLGKTKVPHEEERAKMVPLVSPGLKD